MSVFITRVTLENYKSVERCQVALGSLVFLVGPNGAGKSNFLDALRFTSDALNGSLDHAIRDRGGIKEVRRRSSGHPTHLGVRLDFRLPAGDIGHYSFRVGSRENEGFRLAAEECVVAGAGGEHRFLVRDGQLVEQSAALMPPVVADRLFLLAAASRPEFLPVYEGLSRMAFFNLIPERIRELQSPDAGDRLDRDGSNLASVFARLQREAPQTRERIETFLSKVVPGITGVDVRTLGPKETFEFQQVSPGRKPWSFYATNMSDGTLRAFGVLVALFNSLGSPLVGIEEPESALHPAAAEVLRDALHEASRTTQVLVTSHSPDLLDDPRVEADMLLAVTADGGTSALGAIDAERRSVLKDRLFTAGELLRMNQLQPAPGARLVQGSSLSEL